MTMTLIKKTSEYSIYQRGDERYAVKDADKKPVNGNDKVRILLSEGLIKISEPAAPAEPEPAEDAEGDADGAEAGEASADDAKE